MVRLDGDSVVELWIWIVVLVLVVGIGAYGLEKLRRLSRSGRPGTQDWLSQFRQMHSEGLLSDQEFRTIKNTLIPQVLQEEGTRQTAPIRPRFDKDPPGE